MKLDQATKERVQRYLARVEDFLAHGDEADSGKNIPSEYFLVGVIGIIYAWLSGPLVRYANPAYLFSTASWITVTIVSLIFARSGSSKHWRALFGFAFLASSLNLVQSLYWGTETLKARSKANDERCQIIQDDMLSARPRRSDGPALFQALACQPKGPGKVGFAPVKPPAPAAR